MVTVTQTKPLDLDIDFEGAHEAGVVLYIGQHVIEGTFGEVKLKRTEGGGLVALSAQVAGRTHARLHITTTEQSPAQVGLQVVAPSASQILLTVTRNVIVGDPITVIAVLTDPRPDDTVEMTFEQSGGGRRPIELAPAGRGTWSGTIVPTSPGRADVYAILRGSRLRAATATIDVFAGTVRVAPALCARVSPKEQPGHPGDDFVVVVGLTATSPGERLVRVRLLDLAGNAVGDENLTLDLVAGPNQVEARYDAAVVRESARAGPLLLTVIVYGGPGRSVEAYADNLGPIVVP